MYLFSLVHQVHSGSTKVVRWEFLSQNNESERFLCQKFTMNYHFLSALLLATTPTFPTLNQPWIFTLCFCLEPQTQCALDNLMRLETLSTRPKYKGWRIYQLTRQLSRFFLSWPHWIGSLAGGYYALQSRTSCKMYSKSLSHALSTYASLVERVCNLIRNHLNALCRIT